MKLLSTKSFVRCAFVWVAFGGLAVAQADDQKVSIKVNAFGSAYYGQSFSNELNPFGFVTPGSYAATNLPQFTNFSLVGADLSAKLADDWSVATEVVASGEPGTVSNYQTYAQWFFVTYKPTENTSARLGRQRYPIFTASESVNEHADLPYREIPSVVYRVAPFSTFDGGSVQQTFDVGSAKLSASIFGGTPVLDYPLVAGYTVSFNELIGAKLTLDGDGWRVRVQGSSYVTQGVINESTLSGGLFTGTLTPSGATKVYSVGYRYDKYNLVTWGEYLVSLTPDGTAIPSGLFKGGTYLGSTEAGYVLMGYRIGKFLPRYTYAQYNQSIGLFEGTTASHTVGVNYMFNDNIVGKVEYEYEQIPSAQNGGAVPSQTLTSTVANTSSVYAGIDFKF